jgi:ABC transporter substrate binding protein (PQQ-dependent alcohol dehydrogenase system)
MRLFVAALCLVACAAPAAAEVAVKAAVLKVERERPLPISRLDLPPPDEGFAGARLAIDDNNTTGRFLGQTYALTEVTTTPENALAAFDALRAEGVGIVATIADAEDLLAIADHAAGTDALILNAAAPDDALRGAECRANVMHVAPSRAMLADGLAQYLVWKRWTDWVLVYGSHPQDQAKADAFRRAAEKFGARIVEERLFEDTGGARRSDSGHVLVQRQIPTFMQRLPEHHVVIAADESQIFGVYLPYRGWDPRPVAGDAGLRALNWHPAHESWGATQMQRRFERAAGRAMTDLDYNVWAALRAVGEAVTRAKTAEPAALREYMRSDAFELAAFKGQPLNFRPWNNQLRQAIMLADGRNVVSVSPQEEFLHQRTRLDTLGQDEPDSACDF